MNKELQRIKIAEACGWEINKRKLLAKPPNDSWQYLDTIPDYLNDLNAMHEAEKVLDTTSDQNTIGSYASYAQCLAWDGGYSATAAQRAEAFLRALNLWEP
jgi:hypothetical protein